MNWWPISIGGEVAAILLLFVLILPNNDATPCELFLITPCIAFLIFVLLLLLAFPRTLRGSAKLLLATAAFTATGIVGLRFEAKSRPTVRWTVFSSSSKAEALRQPDQPSGTFKHVEWDGRGGTPVGDWTAYGVFDTADSLESATGRWPGGRSEEFRVMCRAFRGWNRDGTPSLWK